MCWVLKKKKKKKKHFNDTFAMHTFIRAKDNDQWVLNRAGRTLLENPLVSLVLYADKAPDEFLLGHSMGFQWFPVKPSSDLQQTIHYFFSKHHLSSESHSSELRPMHLGFNWKLNKPLCRFESV